MLKNYLKITLRNLRRHKGYTALNVAGLAVGLAACLLIGLYLHHELSYDRFHEKSDRIYRLAMQYGSLGASPLIPAEGAQRMAARFPEVAASVRLYQPETVLLQNGQPVAEEDFFYADPSFFDVFSFPLSKGTPQTALTEPNTVVLTEKTARRYFPDENPMGQTLTLRDGTTLRVTGVAENAPSNSHLQFDFLASFATLPPLRDPEAAAWGYQSYTYFLLSGPRAAQRLETKLAAMTDHAGETADWLGFSVADKQFGLQPLTAIHLRPFFGGMIQPAGNVQTLYLFSVIALFTLLLACINYINLATARSARRSREVGMRKALGAGRRQLARQFLGEAALVTLAAGLGALLLARVLLPGFNHLMGLDLSLGAFRTLPLAALLAGLLLAVSLAAGSYPALVLARLDPVAALKGASRGNTGGVSLRKGLVIFQFTLSIALAACTLVAHSQLRYMRGKPLGYATEAIAEIPVPESLRQRTSTFKNEVARLPGVLSVSASSGVPLKPWVKEVEHDSETLKVNALFVDVDYLKTMGMSLVAGRNFSERFPSDTSTAIIVNEAAARVFGLKEQVGQPLERSLAHEQDRLIGIVRDFHTGSLHEPIRPTLLSVHSGRPEKLVLRLDAASAPAALEAVEALWKAFAPNAPFAYHFLDDMLAAMNQSEERLADLSTAFTLLAALIAALGLFGLAAHAAEQRTKEIGIRKVLGASVASIVGLLTRDFLKLVLVAFAVAAPLAYLGAERWLEDFAYHIRLGPGTFLLAGAAALLIALLTVSVQAVKAALANPTEALRSE